MPVHVYLSPESKVPKGQYDLEFIKYDLCVDCAEHGAFALRKKFRIVGTNEFIYINYYEGPQ